MLEYEIIINSFILSTRQSVGNVHSRSFQYFPCDERRQKNQQCVIYQYSRKIVDHREFDRCNIPSDDDNDGDVDCQDDDDDNDNDNDYENDLAY